MNISVSVSAIGSNYLKPSPPTPCFSTNASRFSIRNRIELFEAATLCANTKSASSSFSIRNRIELFEATAFGERDEPTHVSVSAIGSNYLKPDEGGKGGDTGRRFQYPQSDRII